MMINKKYCGLIVLLVLVVLTRSSESIFSRLTKRSTDDGVCRHSTTEFCTKTINDEKGLLQRFHPDVSHLIQNHFKNATANCKVLLCLMTMYAVIIEGEKYFPNSSFINDEAFINAIKGSSLADCIDNKNNYNTVDSQSEDTNTATIDDKSYTTDSSSNIYFNQFTTATTQQDTQSIKSNEIDGSLSESKHEWRKGIIDILYTNENYTNAAKSKYVNEQTDTELVENNPTIENVSVVNLDKLETETSDSTPPFYNSGENERFDLDVANRIGNRIGMTGTTPVVNENIASTSDFLFDSFFITSTSMPIDSTDLNVDGLTTSSGSNLSGNDGTVDTTKRILTFESTATPTTTANTTALSEVGNVIFQLLGKEGYNSFSCNLTTTGDDYTASDAGYATMYRRTNKLPQTNATSKENEFLPEIPAAVHDDKRIKFLLLEFRILELCNFTSEDQESRTANVSKKLTLCSDAIAKLKTHANGKTKYILEQYSQDLLGAAKKFNVVQESRMKIIKIINLTDYLTSTMKESDIPKDMKSYFNELKQFLLVELKNEDLSAFHPDSNHKDAFMRQLFDYLMQSEIVDNKQKKLLEMFKKFIRNVS